MPLLGKSAVVTGASRGIGRAICLRLAAAGANVLAVARSRADLDETAALCANQPGRVAACPAHSTRPTDVREAVARCRGEFGTLDILVNNAGMAHVGPFDEMPGQTFDDMLKLNIGSVFHACQAAWPMLKESRGTIVNVSSLAATDPFPGLAAYAGTKAWVNLFTRGIAIEGKPLGIRAFVVAPGAVDTAMLRTGFPDFPAEQMLAPDEIAAMVEWLLDDRCANSTGQVIEVKR